MEFGQVFFTALVRSVVLNMRQIGKFPMLHLQPNTTLRPHRPHLPPLHPPTLRLPQPNHRLILLQSRLRLIKKPMQLTLRPRHRPLFPQILPNPHILSPILPLIFSPLYLKFPIIGFLVDIDSLIELVVYFAEVLFFAGEVGEVGLGFLEEVEGFYVGLENFFWCGAHLKIFYASLPVLAQIF